MEQVDFPITGTKVEGLSQKFDLADPMSRQAYFQAKAGKEIEAIKEFLAGNQFIAYFIGKKNSGKGTYSKLFSELMGLDKIVHLSVGDLIREVHGNWEEFSKNEEGQRLKELYRGYISFDEAVERLISRSASALLPSEFILALLRVSFEKLSGKSVFLDGFPRDEDQISYSLFLKELVGRGQDKDMFILIDIPDSVIDERIKYRVICPVCNSPRNIKLLVTKNVGFDENKQEFYLMCDHPGCHNARMLPKEGDNLGIEPITDRLAKDEEVISRVYNLSGVPKVLLRNSMPVDKAGEFFDDYEITPEYSFERDQGTGQIKTKESPWIIKDQAGVDSYSLLAAPVAVALIKQVAEILSQKS